MGGLQLVQLESYWGEILALCLTSRANTSRAGEGFWAGLSANKILINKTGMSGDLGVLLRKRSQLPLNSMCMCPSCSLFSIITPRWEHTFLTSQITSCKIFTFFIFFFFLSFSFPFLSSRQLCAIPSVQGGCMLSFQCSIPFTIILIYQFWHCPPPRGFNFLWKLHSHWINNLAGISGKGLDFGTVGVSKFSSLHRCLSWNSLVS